MQLICLKFLLRETASRINGQNSHLRKVSNYWVNDCELCWDVIHIILRTSIPLYLVMPTLDKLASQVANVPVVGEEYHLCLLRHLCQNPEGLVRPCIVEVHKDVVQDEGHRLSLFHSLLQAGKPEGKIQLIACSVAHAVHPDPASIP